MYVHVHMYKQTNAKVTSVVQLAIKKGEKDSISCAFVGCWLLLLPTHLLT